MLIETKTIKNGDIVLINEKPYQVCYTKEQNYMLVSMLNGIRWDTDDYPPHTTIGHLQDIICAITNNDSIKYIPRENVTLTLEVHLKQKITF